VRHRPLWIAIVLGLLVLRLPSLAQPIGGDQGLYAYEGQRLLHGGVPYIDMWDQKPPAIALVYAILWRVWPHPSVVAAADLVAAGLVAWLLIVLGKRLHTATVGYGAAAIFLLFGNPYLSRLAGIHVRAQCETFIALAATAALVLVSVPRRRRRHLWAAGICLGVACWLKYNAIVLVAPLVVLMLAQHPFDVVSGVRAARLAPSIARDFAVVMAGSLSVTALVLGYFALNGGLTDLRLATIDYNLQYSRETYGGVWAAATHVLAMPILRARVEMLWFLAGLGTLLLIMRRVDRWTFVVMTWLAAALVSIAINGARDLPQYFVQAHPALALLASAGLATLTLQRRLIRIAAGLLLVAGLVRVGVEAPRAYVRLGGLPQLVENVLFDAGYVLRGGFDRAGYLERFAGDKYKAAMVESLIERVRASTRPDDAVLVFGFVGGVVGAGAERVSPTRFFWSRPIIAEFAAGRPGYGSEGLLKDLERHPPALVVLQRQDWHSSVDPLPNSLEFFLATPRLRSWLEASYALEDDGDMFAIWRRRS
jgi:hypothetical protein